MTLRPVNWRRHRLGLGWVDRCADDVGEPGRHLLHVEDQHSDRPRRGRLGRHDNDAKDVLTGGKGSDWYIVSLTDTVKGLEVKIPAETKTIV